MPIQYYDTTVFLHGQNPAHPQHKACVLLTDPEKITWCVAFGVTSESEASITELLASFEATCVLYGVSVRRVTQTEVRAALRAYNGHKRGFRILGLEGNDWKQLVSAESLGVEYLVSDDTDFWDPQAKRNGQHPNFGPVYSLIKKTFSVEPARPDAALANLVP